MLKARAITPEEKQFLLDLPDNRITNSTIIKMFNHYYDRTTNTHHDPMFHPFDTLTVDPGDLKCIHSTQLTTVGIYIYNKYMIDGVGLYPHIKFINKSMNGKDLEALGDQVAQLLLDDKITNEVVNRFLTVRDSFLSMIYQNILPSLTENIMRVQPEIEKMADRLIAENKKAIDDGDLVVMNQIQSKLVDYAKSLLQDDEAMILYQSGSRPEFGNNYKVLSIMRGPIKNEITGKYEFVTSNLVGGMTKHDIPTSANTILASEYPTAIATASSGYQSKKILYFMQGETVGEPGSDCGSKATIQMVATKALAKEYRYFIEGDKINQLNPDNISKYEGRLLKFRTPMGCCRSNGPCNICAGDYAHKLGLKNIGLMASKISGTLLNAKTKTKHNLSYNTNTLKITD